MHLTLPTYLSVSSGTRVSVSSTSPDSPRISRLSSVGVKSARSE